LDSPQLFPTHGSPYRLKHIQTILERFSETSAPLDGFLSHYFRSQKAIGSKDRLFIGDLVYTFIRWWGLIRFLGHYPQDFNPTQYLENNSIPLANRFSLPQELFEELERDYGIDTAKNLALSFNERAPTTLRVHMGRSTREHILERLHKKNILCSPTTTSPWGITLLQRTPITQLEEYKQGLIEIQDEASQLIAQLVKVKPGDEVLDYCAGAGGKSLAIAPMMQGKGQLYLHDIRSHALLEAKRRMKRACIQNVRFSLNSKLKHRMDWVLVDAPCSGTGTLRRNPDLKWKFSKETAHRLSSLQRSIFLEALEFVKPGGHIVYATCSLLKLENQTQELLLLHPNLLKIEEITYLPLLEKKAPPPKDGLFGVVFKMASS
jgi:16S rRNA C967 or C1407 C5-methylase (RsmB/RsmF family)